MKINPNLCTHEWQYANTITKTGTFKPDYVILLYCKKCAKIKTQLASI